MDGISFVVLERGQLSEYNLLFLSIFVVDIDTSGGKFFHFSGARETASMTQGISFQVKRLIYEETQFGY